jgi:hypothetical protein
MRFFSRLPFVCLILTLLGTVTAQKNLTEPTFRNTDIGLKYTFPDRLVSQPKQTLPQDSTGREEILFALWDNPRRSPVPRVVFLYDKRVRPAGATPGMIAGRYLRSFTPPAGARLSQPKKISLAGIAMWRMDYRLPDDSGHPVNSVILIPLTDRRLLVIQMNAPSQRALELLVESLQKLRLEKR